MDLTSIYFAVFIFLLINLLYTWTKQSTTALKVMLSWDSTVNIIGVFSNIFLSIKYYTSNLQMIFWAVRVGDGGLLDLMYDATFD